MALDASLAIVRQDGLRGLSVRRIAGDIGYAGGTLYQLFADLDDLIISLNTETVESLFEAVEPVEIGEPAPTLIRLAEVYMSTVGADRLRWNAVFEYAPPNDRLMPERYLAAVGRLLALVERVIAPLFLVGEEKLRAHEARVMWAGLYGIATLASSRKSSAALDTRAMVHSLAGNYVAGLERRLAEAKKKRRTR